MSNVEPPSGGGLLRASSWRWAWALIAVACLVLYLLGFFWWEVRPGTVLGMSYGIAAVALLLGTALYGMRRRMMSVVSRWRLGSAAGWLRFHLYGGGLFLLLVLMHTGFRLPTGTWMWWLWLLSLWTALSGLAGRALQQWIPRVLASGLSVEVNYDRIPELVAEIRGRAERLVADCDPSVQRLYARKIAPALAAPEHRSSFFFDVTGGARSRLKDLDYLAGLLSSAEKEKLREIERLYRAKLEIDAHYTLQRLLRGWLWVHVPPSVVLLALVAVHVFTVLYY
ncbi:MAG: hypothetical protein V3T72_06105 [Thermoanaerobaculia bacterium]